MCLSHAPPPRYPHVFCASADSERYLGHALVALAARYVVAPHGVDDINAVVSLLRWHGLGVHRRAGGAAGNGADEDNSSAPRADDDARAAGGGDASDASSTSATGGAAASSGDADGAGANKAPAGALSLVCTLWLLARQCRTPDEFAPFVECVRGGGACLFLGGFPARRVSHVAPPTG